MENKKRLGLITVISIGFALGAATGILLHYTIPEGKVRDVPLIDGIFHLIGNGFLRLAQMLVVLLVFCPPVCDSMSTGDMKKLGETGVEALEFCLAATTLIITAAILATQMISPGAGPGLSALGTAQVTIGGKEGLADTLLAIIPVNPVKALTDGDMLPTILFALIVGMILAGLGEAIQMAGNLFNQFSNVMTQMTVMVTKLVPYGVFYLTARIFSGTGFDASLSLLKYMTGVMIALAIQGLVVYMAILRGLMELSPVKFFKKFLPVMGFIFSTAASSAAIPMSIDTLHRKMRVLWHISPFTIPLGAVINMDGTAITQGITVVLASQVFRIRLFVVSYLIVILTATLASMEAAGVSGVELITLSMVFASAGLPMETIALIMETDRILDASRTAVNTIEDTVCAIVVAFQDDGVDRAVFENMEVGRDG